MLRTTRVQPNATDGVTIWQGPQVETISTGLKESSRVEHSCCPNVDLNDQTVHCLYSGEARDESRGAHEDWYGATDTEERVLRLHEFEVCE